MPKTLAENVAFRQSLIERGDADPAVAQQIWHACEQDVLFYFNAFCWVYEPRTKRELPFITWPIQDRAIRQLLKAIHDGSKYERDEDRLIEKSRDMGASWMCLGVIEHQWHFVANSSFLLGSRNENYVDKANDLKALMPKIDFLHNRMPAWLMPKHFERTKLHFTNYDLNSSIDGESTNQDFARGDRRTAILLDEFAAVENGHEILAASADATFCRIFNSTPQGTGNAFYETRELMVKNQPEKIIRLHWTDHPKKRAGLYTTDDEGQLKKLDPGYVYPPDYSFVLDGQMRSPRYDREDRRRHPREMAQEWNIDYLGSDTRFFEETLIVRMLREFSIPPLLVGKLEYDSTFRLSRFVEQKDGYLKLWCDLDAFGNPLQDRDYGMGIDVSTGMLASDSVISLGDKKTAEKVLELAGNNIKPEKLAEYAVVVARWFAGLSGGAFMIWEANGPGANFGDRVIEIGYSNFFYRKNEQSIAQKVSDVPGWYSTDRNKLVVANGYRRALTDGSFINRSADALDQCRQYIYTKNSTVEHVSERSKINQAGANKSHGDRVIADCLCFKAMGELPRIVEPEMVKNMPAHCPARRLEQARKEKILSQRW